MNFKNIKTLFKSKNKNNENQILLEKSQEKIPFLLKEDKRTKNQIIELLYNVMEPTPRIDAMIFDHVRNEPTFANCTEIPKFTGSIDAAILLKNAIAPNFMELEIIRSPLAGEYSIMFHSLDGKGTVNIDEYVSEPAIRCAAAIQASQLIKESSPN